MLQALVQSAAQAGACQQLSAAEYFEYWKALRHQVAGMLDPDKLLDVASGLAALKVEPITTAAIAPEQVFAAPAQQRRSRQPRQSVSGALLRYQASKAQPGLLEEIKPNGNRRAGRFRHGLFEPVGEN